jgi:predicted nucleic acid-binding protein
LSIFCNFVTAPYAVSGISPVKLFFDNGLTDQIIVQATDIYAGLYKHGELVSDADILIAATAVVHGLILITGNVGHFQRIPGLQVLSWRST